MIIKDQFELLNKIPNLLNVPISSLETYESEENSPRHIFVFLTLKQKYIKHFKQLGVESTIIADIMLYNIEIAQTFSSEREIKQDAFYKSMLKSFQEAVEFIYDNHLQNEFGQRLQNIVNEAVSQGWYNSALFEKALVTK